MDAALEDWILPNNTDELNNFAFNRTTWDIVQDTAAITFATLGLISDIVIICMIARNARMRSKTNLLLMSFVICDACSLICNIHYLSAALELFGYTRHFSDRLNCSVNLVDVGFQTTESIFLLLIISNTLIKNKRIQVKWILIVLYSLIVLNIAINIFTCYYSVYTTLVHVSQLLMFINFNVVLVKEFNNCYKKWYKKDPLSSHTLFRLNIGRIYTICWIFSFIFFMLEGFVFRTFFILAQTIYLTGFYTLLYIVFADKNFKICFLNLVRCKGTGDYDVDATITFAEDLSQTSQDNNQVNINFNAMKNATRPQVPGITTIQTPSH